MTQNDIRTLDLHKIISEFLLPPAADRLLGGEPRKINFHGYNGYTIFVYPLYFYRMRYYSAPLKIL